MLLVFLAGSLVLLGLASIWSDLYRSDKARIGRRMDEETRKRQRTQIQESVLFKNKSNAKLDESFQDDKGQPTASERFRNMVERSGLDLTPERLLVIMAAMAFAIGLPFGWWRNSIVIGAMAGMLGAAIPYLYVLRKWRVRRDKMIQQLPEAFDLMSRVIRAGQTMWQAIQSVADEFEQPLGVEFAYCYEQQNLGISSDLALRDLARRTGILEVKIFVLAMLVQQQTGGNLAEALDNMSHVLRARFQVRRKIQALTAEGRLQAIVLLILPIALLFIMMMFSSQYATAIAGYPNMIVAMVIVEGLGALWIRKIVNFDF